MHYQITETPQQAAKHNCESLKMKNLKQKKLYQFKLCNIDKISGFVLTGGYNSY